MTYEEATIVCMDKITDAVDDYVEYLRSEYGETRVFQFVISLLINRVANWAVHWNEAGEDAAKRVYERLGAAMEDACELENKRIMETN